AGGVAAAGGGGGDAVSRRVIPSANNRQLVVASRCGSIPRAALAGSPRRGFTLIEVLVATALLAAGLALGFATLRAATATVERGEERAQQNELMRAVEGFLRRRLASAHPFAFEVDERTGNALLFTGEPDRMRFVSDLPPFLGDCRPAL